MSLNSKIHAKVSKEIDYARDRPRDPHGPPFGGLRVQDVASRIAAQLRIPDDARLRALVRADLDARDNVQCLDARPSARLHEAYRVLENRDTERTP